MFKINGSVHDPGEFWIYETGTSKLRYLHSDGSVYNTREYWPTRELAQAVLDKFQPKHVWKHGDVFVSNFPSGYVARMIYLAYNSGFKLFNVNRGPIGGEAGNVKGHFDCATFLFNVRDIIQEKL